MEEDECNDTYHRYRMHWVLNKTEIFKQKYFFCKNCLAK